MSKEAIKEFFDKTAASYYAERYAQAKDLCSHEMITRKIAVFSLLDKYQLKDGKLLDAGCGSAVMVNEYLERGFEVCGIDISAEMIKEAKKNAASNKARFWVGDVEKMDLPSEIFDVVVSIGVLDYLKDDKAVLAEFLRVLKPGGAAVLSVSNVFSPVHIIRTMVAPLAKIFSRHRANEKVFCASFTTRAHNPWEFDKTLANCGLKKIEAKFIGSSFMPFNVKLPRFYFSMLKIFNGIFSKIPFGSGYVVLVKKKANG
ncbi:MAG: methyltransferase domain-containing protein [bacterium]